MRIITLIGTRHEARGMCNAAELYSRIDAIRPEVVFVEIPPSFHDAYFVDKSRMNLESETLLTYSEHHTIKIVSIDSNDLPDHKCFERYERMADTIDRQNDQCGRECRSHLNKDREYIFLHGFDYLNSSYKMESVDILTSLTKQALQIIGDEELIAFFQHWNELHDRRENAWVRNIHEYCKLNQFDKAVFLVGAHHRKSLVAKIGDCDQKDSLPKWRIMSSSVRNRAWEQSLESI